MNTTSTLTAAALLACTIPAVSQDDPFGGPSESARPEPRHADSHAADPFGSSQPQPRRARPAASQPDDPFAAPAPRPVDQALLQIVPNLNIEDTRLDDVVAYLQEVSDKPLNFVVKDGADQVSIRSMRLRNVTMQTVLDTIEALAPVRIATIAGKGDGAPVIVIESKVASPQLVPAAARTTVRPLQPGDRAAPRRVPMVAQVGDPKAPSITRAYPVKPMLDTIKMDSLLELIDEFWNRSEPGWSDKWGKDAISLHEATGMLIVRAPAQRHVELEELLQGLGSTVDVARVNQQAHEETLKEMRELQHRAQLAMQTAEEQRAVRANTEAKLRDELEQKDQQIQQLDRMISELKHELEKRRNAQ